MSEAARLRLEEVKKEKKLVEKELSVLVTVVEDLRKSRDALTPRSAAQDGVGSPRHNVSASPRSPSTTLSKSVSSPSPRSLLSPRELQGSPRSADALSSPRHSKPLSYLPEDLRGSREVIIVPPRGTKTPSPRRSLSVATRPVMPKLSVTSPPASPLQAEPVIREVLRTEEAYVRDLGLVLKHFVEPCRSVLRHDEVATLFANTDKLEELHKVFYAELCVESKLPHDVQNWGRVFKQHVMAFRTQYQRYTKNQGKARMCRIALEQGHEQFRATIAAALKHPDIRLTDLNSYLIKPVQRICKYPLLLRELSKAFEGMGIVNEAARRDLAESMAEMGDVLMEANDFMSTLRPSRMPTPEASVAVAGVFAPHEAVCEFCKKAVSPKERREEEGLLFHTGLCYVRYLGQYLSGVVLSREELDQALVRAQEEQARAQGLLQDADIEKALIVPSLQEHLRSVSARLDEDEDEIDDDP